MTLSAGLTNALNCVSTAFYDPKPAAVHFISTTDRRDRQLVNSLLLRRSLGRTVIVKIIIMMISVLV